MNFLKEITLAIGKEKVTADRVDRICYRRNCGPDLAGTPAIVVKPETTGDVVQVLSTSNRHGKPVFIWGRGTIFEGMSVTNSSVILDMGRLDRIVEINENEMIVRVQAGVIWSSLLSQLNKRGLELPVIGPGGLICTVGGSIANSSIPHGQAGAGSIGESVVGLEVVLPSGEVVRTGSASNPAASSFERYCLGPDLTGMFVGSGGTLGAITEATLKISRTPQAEGFYCYGFGKYETGVRAVSRLQKEGLTNNMVLVSGCLPTNGECMLHIVTRGTTNRVQENGQVIKELCEKQGGTKIDSHSTSKFWKTHQYSWLRQQSPETWDKTRHWAETGGYVSLPQLLKCYGVFRKYLRDFSIEKEKVLLETFDVYVTRNAAFLWIDILYDESNMESWQNAIKVRNKLDEIMFSLGLCPIGVSGSIFPGHMESLRSRPLLRSLKKALDPKNILNPMIF